MTDFKKYSAHIGLMITLLLTVLTLYAIKSIKERQKLASYNDDGCQIDVDGNQISKTTRSRRRRGFSSTSTTSCVKKYSDIVLMGGGLILILMSTGIGKFAHHTVKGDIKKGDAFWGIMRMM
jgi:hypothetical protein